jgi:2-keto-4-pentenoate hydratase
VRNLIGHADTLAVYQVQSINIEASLASGRRVVGRKIAFTSLVGQLGRGEPYFGFLLDDMQCSDGEVIQSSRLIQPRIGAEIAFFLSHDIVAPIAAEHAPSLVSEVCVALEVVDSRVADWDIALVDAIADNASSGLYILGERFPLQFAPDPSRVEMYMTENGIPVSSGSGNDGFDSPWSSLAWLANTALKSGTGLRTDDVVLTGPLGPMVTVEPGATYAASGSGLGEVTATFSL